MSEQICKVIALTDYPIAQETGLIPDQPADRNCPFVHACEPESIFSIIQKFYSDKEVQVVLIDKNLAEQAGFRAVYEQNHPNGAFYWHFYRPENNPSQLLPFCFPE